MADPIRIVLTDLPRMLREILEESVAARDDMCVVGEPLDAAELARVIEGGQADAVIGGSGRLGEGEVSRLLLAYPQLKLVAVQPDGRGSALHELRPLSRTLGEASAPRLLEEIRTAAQPRKPAAACPGGGA